MSISPISGGSPQVWTGASVRTSPSTKMANLFDQIDSSGSGSISKSQFEQAFQTLNPPRGVQQAGADAIWNVLDPNHTGSVNKHDFVTGMATVMKEVRAHHHSSANPAQTATPAATDSFASMLSTSLNLLNQVTGQASDGAQAKGSSIDVTG